MERQFSEQEQVRRDKLEEIKKYCNPYPEKYNVTHKIKDARLLEDGTTDVAIAGRIVFMRKMGKLSFVRIRDIEGDMQLEIKIDIVGEEKYAKGVAAKIVEQRSVKEIETTLELVDIIDSCIPYKDKRHGHPAKRVFQAIRIEVNNELGEFKKALTDALEVLNVDGYISCITFHSLEDRICKNIFKSVSEVDPVIKGLPNVDPSLLPDYEIVTKKPILPSDMEINENPRSKSAKLRIIKRIK